MFFKAKKIGLVLMCLCVIPGFVAPQQDLNFHWIEFPLKPHLNSELTGLEKFLYGNERINVYDSGGNVVGSLGTLAGHFNHMSKKQWDDSTVDIYISDQDMIKRIIGAEDKGAKIKNEMKRGRLRVEPKSLGGKIRFKLVVLLANRLW